MAPHDDTPCHSSPSQRWRAVGTGLLLGLLLAGYVVLSMREPEVPEPAVEPAATPAPPSERLEKEGIVVEFSIGRPGSTGTEQRPLMEGDDVEIRFRLTDATSGLPLRGLSPAAWMDLGQALPGKPEAQQECKDRVALYLKGLVGIRPLIDLNSYYLLVLNRDPSISVIDPLVGMTGKTSLYATILLERPGADWLVSHDERSLFVSMPRAGKVAVVDVQAFKVTAVVEAGEEPTRVALQPDGRYLWVGNDARGEDESGVTVIDTESRTVVASLATGRGHHELAFTPDDRYAFVSNRDEGTVSVIDIARLKKVQELKTGAVPISLAFSPLSQVLYVADGKEGTIVAIDGARLEEVARIAAKPGLGPMRFTRDGRWGFVVNTSEHVVHVIDAAENRLAHTIPVGGKPYQVAFTRAFAYVRLLDSERVEMINLSTLGGQRKPTVQGFATGATAPGLAGELSLADAIAQASTEAAIFALNPAENTTYFYMEGMNAPMGSFGNYGHTAQAVAVVDRSLKELEPGVHATRQRLPAAGRYDIAFLLDSPRVLHCFSAEVKENPALRQELGLLEIDYQDFPVRLAAGAVPRLRFKLNDAATHQPRTGLDVRVLTYRAPGRHRAEVPARELADGVYEASPKLAGPGAYYLHVSVPSVKMPYGELAYRTLWVEGAAKNGPTSPEERASSQEAAGDTQVD